jgi:hypothetical protein
MPEHPHEVRDGAHLRSEERMRFVYEKVGNGPILSTASMPIRLKRRLGAAAQ